jgi:hypothetical protein
MFEWRYQGGGRIERPGYRELGLTWERRENVVWLTIALWCWSWHWRRLDGVTRETGPEDNAAVLGWFWRGGRRSKDRAFVAGFHDKPRRPAERRKEPLPWVKRGDGPHAPMFLMAESEEAASDLRRRFPGINVEIAR